jgi:phage terminase small subunit
MRRVWKREPSLPRLSNHRYELFSQARAAGLDLAASAKAAGYRGLAASGWQLERRPEIAERIGELLAEAADRAAIKAEAVLRELARIAFFEPRSVMRWTDAQTEVYEANPDDLEEDEIQALEEEVELGTVEKTAKGFYLRRVQVESGVLVKPSDEITADAAAAIAEIVQTSQGVRVKFHNKLAALEMLGKYLQLWTEAQANKGVPYAITDKPMSTDGWLKQFTDKDGETQH